MKIGAMNHPRGNYVKEIDWIGRSGFQFVDLTYEPPESQNFDLKKIGEILKKYKLAVVGHSNPSLPAIYPIRDIRSVCLSELRKTALVFKELGAKKMSIHPFYNAPHLSGKEIFELNIEVFREVIGYCQDFGLELMLENYLSPFDSPETFEKIIKEVPGLKVHLDIGHCNLEGDAHKIVDRFFEKFGSKIIHMHIHDNDGESDEHLPLGCGCGDIDWAKMIKSVKKFGYDNTITLEVFCEDEDFLLLSRDKLIKLWNG